MEIQFGVKPTISEQHCPRFQAGQQRHDKTVVVRIARRRTGKPKGIDDCMNLGRQSNLATGRSIVHCYQRHAQFTSAFGGAADMAEHAAGRVPVENDPLQTSLG